MARPETALREAMYRLVGQRVTVTELRTPSYASLLSLYGSNAAIATAAGFPTAASVGRAHLARYPKARKATVAKRRADARRERSSFLRNLERYRRGETKPAKMKPLIERLEREEVERRRTLQTVDGVARSMRDDGVTVDVFSLVMDYDGRYRKGLPRVTFGGRARVPVPGGFIESVERRDWVAASRLFWQAWGDAYGAYLDPNEVEGLELEIGNDPRAYGYAGAA